MSATLPPELKQVQLALQHHRRTFGRRRIPDTIRQQTLDLLMVCSRKQVVNTLGISYKMLCRWEQEQSASALTTDATPLDFIPLPLAAEAVAMADNMRPLPAIEWRFSDEVMLAFHGEHATAQCLALLQGLGYRRQAVANDQVVCA